MTPSSAAEGFQRHLERSENYFAAVEAAGDLPWYEDPEKLSKLESRIPGITSMDTKERRRALFMRHRTDQENDQ